MSLWSFKPIHRAIFTKIFRGDKIVISGINIICGYIKIVLTRGGWNLGKGSPEQERTLVSTSSQVVIKLKFTNIENFFSGLCHLFVYFSWEVFENTRINPNLKHGWSIQQSSITSYTNDQVHLVQNHFLVVWNTNKKHRKLNSAVYGMYVCDDSAKFLPIGGNSKDMYAMAHYSCHSFQVWSLYQHGWDIWVLITSLWATTWIV